MSRHQPSGEVGAVGRRFLHGKRDFITVPGGLTDGSDSINVGRDQFRREKSDSASKLDKTEFHVKEQCIQSSSDRTDVWDEILQRTLTHSMIVKLIPAAKFTLKPLHERIWRRLRARLGTSQTCLFRPTSMFGDANPPHSLSTYWRN